MRSRRRRVLAARRGSGFTLVELLVSAAIAGVVIAAAYGWLWNVAALASSAGDRAQAKTIVATCARFVEREVQASVAVVPPPAGRDPVRSLALVHDHVDEPREDVLVVWDPSRAVVWRNASGTYLADHITAFAVAYDLADGRRVSGDHMATSDWSSVRCVTVDLTATVGSVQASLSLVMSGAGSS